MTPDIVTDLSKSVFGEGMAPRNSDEFLVLTWKERKVYIMDRNTLEITGELHLPYEISEGWGITADESQVDANGHYKLYVSDGSWRVYEVDGETFEVVRSFNCRQNGSFVNDINELEFVNGYIYANIWFEDRIVKIDPSDGTIDRSWDISILESAERRFQLDKKNRYTGNTTNGIAYDPINQVFFLSGKKYHLIFKVTLD